MTRGKYVNHKGRTRQFTPADVLQQEYDMMFRIKEEDDPVYDQDEGDESNWELNFDLEENYVRPCGVHGLIEISNPNRLPPGKDLSHLIALTSRERGSQLDDGALRRRRKRKHARIEIECFKKSSSDLAKRRLRRQKSRRFRKGKFPQDDLEAYEISGEATIGGKGSQWISRQEPI
ncbi:28 kDa heat- and acid-stable phosphoprotein-like [Drosophila ficusphila]|uniref:28 kDa heat- and acid-stable phosphoprotein-like n=1 Tax=Drosophila ficusphila TaxID=30025 RepID=UPI0007E61544|nr:28 kDa heat- and acid-stable phosphoprotein-like [Drosophila ficusphila]